MRERPTGGGQEPLEGSCGHSGGGRAACSDEREEPIHVGLAAVRLQAASDGTQTARDAPGVEVGGGDGCLCRDNSTLVELAALREGIREPDQIERVVTRIGDRIVQRERCASRVFAREGLAERQRGAVLVTGEVRGAIEGEPARLVVAGCLVGERARRSAACVLAASPAPA